MNTTGNQTFQSSNVQVGGYSSAEVNPMSLTQQNRPTASGKKIIKTIPMPNKGPPNLPQIQQRDLY